MLIGVEPGYWIGLEATPTDDQLSSVHRKDSCGKIRMRDMSYWNAGSQPQRKCSRVH